MPAPLLELTAIAKRYPCVTSLDGVEFSLLPGEVHCLYGSKHSRGP